jgi:glucose dehydrogenase
MNTSGPLIAGNIAVVGGWVTDNQQLGNVSGVIRAYDTLTGQFVWAWDMGNPGFHGLPDEGAEYTRGTPNVWSLMSYDPQLNTIYAPTGNSSPDYFDGDLRTPEAETYASSVVAIDAATGSPKWHFQTVHRDIWDWDVPSQPVLVDVKKDGQVIPAVAQPTKRGDIFLLDRRDGKPIYPIEERAVPQNPEVGETVTATQPFSPLPDFRPDRWEKDMWGITPLDHLWCRVAYKRLRYEGHFTPPMRANGRIEGTFQYPGNAGGFNWGSVSVDADNGLLVAAPMMMGNKITLLSLEDRAKAREEAQARAERARARSGNQETPAAQGGPSGPGGPAAAPGQGGGQRGQGGGQGGGSGQRDPRFDPSRVLYTANTAPFMSEWKVPVPFLTSKPAPSAPAAPIGTEVPCFEPPYSKIGVIDLNTNKLLWSRPLGSMKESGPFGMPTGLPFMVGTPVQAGSLTTRGGLIFHGGAMDSTLRAFNLRNGKVVWQSDLPGSAHATPMSYFSARTGKQYVVITVPNPSWRYPRIGNLEPSDDQGGYVIAYALKDNAQ